MLNDVSRESLHLILNKTISNYRGNNNDSINSEMLIYKKKYDYVVKNEIQLDVFSSPIPLQLEVIEAAIFCSNLDEYKKSIDVDNEEPIQLSKQTYRDIYNYISKNYDIFEKEHCIYLDAIQKSMKRHIPEFQEEMILLEYNNEAKRIQEAKKDYDKKKRQGLNPDKWHERHCVEYFKQFFINKNILNNVKDCPLKFDMFKNSLEIVNYLPQRYFYGNSNCTSKSLLKKKLSEDVLIISRNLGSAYKDVTKKCYEDYLRYNELYLNAKSFAQKNKSLTPKEIAKKREEEWLCK